MEYSIFGATMAQTTLKAPKSKRRRPEVALAIDKRALRKLKLVAVAYSYVERAMFATEDAYKAEIEVEERSRLVMEMIERLGIPVKGYPGDSHLIAALQI